VQKPLALVVVGGILVAPLLILVVLPVLIELFTEREALDRVTDAEMQMSAGE
jgi:cobalt-zinc-cadmium resistance protein CzcA